MRIPDPIANTTTEAYLAYKAGVLAEGDLKPKLYDPYIHLDAWLAYWAGLVATYPVDKNNDPEMLTDEEALIAYLSGVTNTYPEEFRDPADVRVAAYLKYLVSARWGRPEYPVTNEELYLSMMDAPYIPAGEPSSDIEIDDTAEAPFRDVKMYGDTSQTTYTGKNLINLGPKSDGGVSGAITDGSTVTVTGTALVTDGRAVAELLTTLEAGTYTFTIDHAATHVINFVVNTSDGNIAFRLGAGETSITKTLASASTGGSVFWAITQGQTYNETFKLQLVAGSTADYDFEPYVGGVPAPNPDYPQAVQTVTGENVVKISDGQGNEQSYEVNLGKNLFNPANAAHPTGMPNNLGETLSVVPNTTYSFNVGSTRNFAQVKLYDKSGTNTRTLGNGVNDHLLTFTTSASEVSALVCFYPGSRGVDPTTYDYTGVQFELGQPTTYAAYFEPIELCKIGDYQDYIYENEGKWYVHKEVGKAVLDGSESWYNAGGNAPYGLVVDDGLITTDNDTPPLVYCDKFYSVSQNASWSSYSSLISTSNTAASTNTIRIRYTSVASLSAFRTWLGLNNTILYYALATPTDTEITNTALIDQLNALKNGGSYTGTTYIKVSATDPNLPGLLKVEAYKYD